MSWHCPSDMWYWPGETQDNAAEDDEEAKDMWAWEIDKKTSMMERIEQRISDAMWSVSVPPLLPLRPSLPLFRERDCRLP